MKNIIDIDGHRAVVSFDPDIAMFRGEFAGLSCGADFYATSVDQLHAEGRKSLTAYLEICSDKDIAPYRTFSGRFNVRLDPKLHAAAVTAADAEQKSLNEWIAQAVANATKAS